MQHPLGKLGESGLKGLIHELAARLGHALHHAVEFMRQLADLVAAAEIEPRREVFTLADDDGVPCHLRQRIQNHAVQDQ